MPVLRRSRSPFPRARAATRRGIHRIALTVLLPAAMGCAVTGSLSSQEPDTVVVRSEPATPAAVLQEVGPGPTPGGAFLRALLIPGWGHASIGEYTRGGFYALAESGTAWMIVRNTYRLRAARAARELWLSEVAAELAARGITDPEEVLAAQDADPLVIASRSLVDARSQQFEDWLALGIFLIFLSGVDAFVSAHLQDFPDPVRLDVRPEREGLEVGLSIPLGRSPGRRGPSRR